MDPVWMYFPIDTSAINDTIIYQKPRGKDSITVTKILYDGRHHLNFSRGIVHKGSFYTIFIALIGERGGAFIAKLDAATGEVLWTQAYDQRTLPTSEVPQNMYIDDNENLVVLGFRNKYYNHIASKFVKRVYDKETGELIAYDFAPESDTLAPKLWASSAFLLSHLWPYSEDAYLYLSSQHRGNQLNSYLLDEQGRTIESTKINFSGRYSEQYVGDINRIGKDSIIAIQISLNTDNTWNDTFKYEFYLRYLTPQLDTLKNYNITKDLDSMYYQSRVQITYVDKDYVILYVSRESVFRLNRKKFFLIYDHHGNLLEKIPLVNPDTDHRFWYASIQKMEKDKFMIFANDQYQGNTQYPLFLYTKKLNEPMKLMKRWKISPNNMASIPIYWTQLDNGDYLLKFYNQQDSIYPNGTKRSARLNRFWARVSSFELNLTSSVDESEKHDLSMTILPNPADEVIRLTFTELFTGSYQLTTLEGKIVKSGEIENSASIHISIGHLSPGMYLMTAHTWGKSSRMLSQKVMIE